MDGEPAKDNTFPSDPASILVHWHALVNWYFLITNQVLYQLS